MEEHCDVDSLRQRVRELEARVEEDLDELAPTETDIDITRAMRVLLLVFLFASSGMAAISWRGYVARGVWVQLMFNGIIAGILLLEYCCAITILMVTMRARGPFFDGRILSDLWRWTWWRPRSLTSAWRFRKRYPVYLQHCARRDAARADLARAEAEREHTEARQRAEREHAAAMQRQTAERVRREEVARHLIRKARRHYTIPEIEALLSELAAAGRSDDGRRVVENLRTLREIFDRAARMGTAVVEECRGHILRQDFVGAIALLEREERRRSILAAAVPLGIGDEIAALLDANAEDAARRRIDDAVALRDRIAALDRLAVTIVAIPDPHRMTLMELLEKTRATVTKPREYRKARHELDRALQKVPR